VQLEDYFTEKALVRAVVSKRRQLASQRHEKQLFASLGEQLPRIQPAMVEDLLPHRADWQRLDRLGRQKLDAKRARIFEIERPTLTGLRRGLEPWAQRLQAFIETVRAPALSSTTVAITPIAVVPKLKQGHAYRPVCRYSLLDSVLESQVACYLRDFFDPYFVPESYAYRAHRQGAAGLEHQAAAESLMRYRAAFHGVTLAVAEVDIQAFYDSLHHDVARAAIAELVARAASEGRTVDPRALRVLEAYIAGYAFRAVALPLAQEWFLARDPQGVMAWPVAELAKYWGNPEREPIGIPQGGSLSQLLANAVLDRADRAVVDTLPRQHLLYARYLDDVIIAHPSAAVVGDAFDRYLAALTDLKLPFHPPMAQRRYDAHHWDAKTRAPYSWTGSRRSGCAPWVGFVGYQIRFDGVVRVRPSSVAKEMRKVAGICRRVGASSRVSGLRVSVQDAVRRVRGRLVASSVGRQITRGHVPRFCWAFGFRLLRGRSLVSDQLSALDRHREHQLRVLARRLVPPQVWKRRRPKGRLRLPRFWGYAYSYRRAFE
jgi:hypothetical protein